MSITGNTGINTNDNVHESVSKTFTDIIHDIIENKQYTILDVFWKDNRPIHIGSVFLIISIISAIYYIYRNSLIPQD